MTPTPGPDPGCTQRDCLGGLDDTQFGPHPHIPETFHHLRRGGSVDLCPRPGAPPSPLPEVGCRPAPQRPAASALSGSAGQAVLWTRVRLWRPVPISPRLRAAAGCALHGRNVLPETRIHDGELVPPVESLERYFRSGGTTILQAAFEHSYFVHPDRVRQNTPLYPDRARLSREHYPGLDRGAHAMWQGAGSQARRQREGPAGLGPLYRTPDRTARPATASGMSGGHPWDPDAFTAGWNLCYMPFWAGMLTERQHPHPELEKAVRQAAWDFTSATIRFAPRQLRHRPRRRSRRHAGRAADPASGRGKRNRRPSAGSSGRGIFSADSRPGGVRRKASGHRAGSHAHRSRGLSRSAGRRNDRSAGDLEKSPGPEDRQPCTDPEGPRRDAGRRSRQVLDAALRRTLVCVFPVVEGRSPTQCPEPDGVGRSAGRRHGRYRSEGPLAGHPRSPVRLWSTIRTANPELRIAPTIGS